MSDVDDLLVKLARLKRRVTAMKNDGTATVGNLADLEREAAELERQIQASRDRRC
jgi:phage-related minor tail protein